jgi:hypothetical protein
MLSRTDVARLSMGRQRHSKSILGISVLRLHKMLSLDDQALSFSCVTLVQFYVRLFH